MKPGHMLDLEADEWLIPISVEEVETFTSPHTGAELRKITGEATTSELEMHDWFLGVVKKAGGADLPSRPGPLAPAARWKIALRQWSQSGGHYSYRVQLTEAEELNLESLVIDGLELHPYEYRESFDTELMVIARVILTEEQVRFVRERQKAGAQFPVVRRGIDSKPRTMRFGQLLWSKHEEGTKYRLVLVDITAEKESDEGENGRRHLSFIDDIGQLRRALSFHIAFIRELRHTLVSKGVFSDQELEELMDRGQSRGWDVEQEFFGMTDIDLVE